MLDNELKSYLLPNLFNAAVRAGAAIMQVYKNKEDYDISIKSDKTPITVADRRAHETIKTYLGPTRIPILSEEGREMRYEERCNWELFWLVDPLDGTVEFIKGNNEFTGRGAAPRRGHSHHRQPKRGQKHAAEPALRF